MYCQIYSVALSYLLTVVNSLASFRSWKINLAFSRKKSSSCFKLVRRIRLTTRSFTQSWLDQNKKKGFKLHYTFFFIFSSFFLNATFFIVSNQEFFFAPFVFLFIFVCILYSKIFFHTFTQLLLMIIREIVETQF